MDSGCGRRAKHGIGQLIRTARLLASRLRWLCLFFWQLDTMCLAAFWRGEDLQLGDRRPMNLANFTRLALSFAISSLTTQDMAHGRGLLTNGITAREIPSLDS